MNKEFTNTNYNHISFFWKTITNYTINWGGWGENLRTFIQINSDNRIFAFAASY